MRADAESKLVVMGRALRIREPLSVVISSTGSQRSPQAFRSMSFCCSSLHSRNAVGLSGLRSGSELWLQHGKSDCGTGQNRRGKIWPPEFVIGLGVVMTGCVVFLVLRWAE